jgi:hypothetical protein
MQRSELTIACRDITRISKTAVWNSVKDNSARAFAMSIRS